MTQLQSPQDPFAFPSSFHSLSSRFFSDHCNHIAHCQVLALPSICSPVVLDVHLDVHEQEVLNEKLQDLQAASSDDQLMPERYSEQAGDRVIHFTQREINSLIAREETYKGTGI
jgi:hypothetical protein